MVSEAQAAHVRALISERHGAVKSGFDKLLDAIARLDQDQVHAANEHLLSELIALKQAIAVEHWPSWLKDLSNNCENYRTNHPNGLGTWIAHLKSIINNYRPVERETWNFSDRTEVFFDVDGIVARAVADNCIDDLYGKIVECLRALLDSGHVDSVRANADLSRLIDSLDSARAGTFQSKVFNWAFARRLLPNIILAYVKRSAVTGPLLEAIEQTASELDVSLEKTKDQIGQEILSAAAAVLKTDCSEQINAATFLALADFKSVSD